MAPDVPALVAELYRTESRRVLATLIRLLGDFELAEEGLSEAFAAALARWPADGVPARPRAWLVSAGRFKAIDALRRRARFDAAMAEVAVTLERRAGEAPVPEEEIEDDRLRLVFACCHPELSPEAQVALTLREVCGLTTEAIARAFLAPPATVAQRIVRAKAALREGQVPYLVPSGPDLAARLPPVLKVVYLVFNEGYKASEGDSLTRRELSDEALALGRLLAGLLPLPEVLGLVALMLLHEARRVARTGPDGDLVLLADQDRSLWDRAAIAEGTALLERALGTGPAGPYTLQAAIAALHAEAPDVARTDWAQIVGLYALLEAAEPSPVVALNAAVALAMRDGPAAGLARIEALLAARELADYQPAHAARADLLRRLGRRDEARAAYRRALALTALEPERRFLAARLAEV